MLEELVGPWAPARKLRLAGAQFVFYTVITAYNFTNICSFSSPFCLNYPKMAIKPIKPIKPSGYPAIGQAFGRARACLGSEDH